jgi:hypothetical protein
MKWYKNSSTLQLQNNVLFLDANKDIDTTEAA